jgi:hypothetical protein
MSTDRFPARPGRLCDWCSYKEICPAWGDDRSDDA